MAKTYTQIVTPVGRIVGGAMERPRTKDSNGVELAYKDGTPAAEYSVLLAIPKGGEAHWKDTPWGAQIWSIGDKGYPGGHVNNPAFSWKIQDGDSQVPNQKGKRNCDREGYAGHWIIAGSKRCPRDRLTPPQYVDIRTNPKNPIAIPVDAIKPGYYAQICISVADNTPSPKPGVFVNAEIVALAAYGEVIQLGMEIDAASVGFGGFALPAGAMTTPPAGLQAPAPAAPAAAPAVPVQPNHAFANGPAPMAPPAAPAAPAAPVRQMLPAAGGVTYEAYIAAGWTDAQLIANGMMAG